MKVILILTLSPDFSFFCQKKLFDDPSHLKKGANACTWEGRGGGERAEGKGQGRGGTTPRC